MAYTESMLGWINNRIKYDRGMVLVIIVVLVIVQSLRLHAHTFTDHLARFDHTHPAEIHIAGWPTTSGHDDFADTDTAGAVMTFLVSGSSLNSC